MLLTPTASGPQHRDERWGQAAVEEKWASDASHTSRVSSRKRSKLSTLTRDFAVEHAESLADVARLAEQARNPSLVDRQRTNMTITDKEIASLSGWPRTRALIARTLHSREFNVAMGIVILANTINIGFEQSYRTDGESGELFDWLEFAFLIVYTLEVVLNVMALGWKCLKDNWWRFDVVMVVIGWGTGFLLTSLKDDLNFVLVLRTARPLRLVRAVRLLARFRDLWMLVRGLLTSAGTMFYTFFLLTLMLFVCSSIAFELITQHGMAIGPDADEEFRAIADMYFPTLPVAMMTMMQFVTMDNMVFVYKPLVEKDWTLMVYFCAVILVISIVLMNLVTAVVVNSAMEQASQDRELIRVAEEHRQKRLVRELKDMFKRLDEDGSGLVTMEEVVAISIEDRMLLQTILHISDPVEIFHALDVDSDGRLDIDEFCDGILNVTISKVPVEVKRTEKKVDMLRDELLRQQQKDPYDGLAAIVREAVRAELCAFGLARRGRGCSHDLDGTGGTGEGTFELVQELEAPAASSSRKRSTMRQISAEMLEAKEPQRSSVWSNIKVDVSQDAWPPHQSNLPAAPKKPLKCDDSHPSDRCRSRSHTSGGSASSREAEAPVRELLSSLEAAFARQATELAALRSGARSLGSLIAQDWPEQNPRKGERAEYMEPTLRRREAPAMVSVCSAWNPAACVGEKICERLNPPAGDNGANVASEVSVAGPAAGNGYKSLPPAPVMPPPILEDTRGSRAQLVAS